jgi:hypothetical protein
MQIQEKDGQVQAESSSMFREAPDTRPERLSGAEKKHQNWLRLRLAQRERRLAALDPPPPQPKVARGRQGVARQQWREQYEARGVAVLGEAEYQSVDS